MSIHPSPTRFIRRDELQQITGLSRSTIYDRLDRRSAHFDQNFPRPIKIGKSAVGWIQSEVTEYVETLIQRSRSEVTDA